MIFFKWILIISSLDLELLLFLIFHKIDETQRYYDIAL